MRCSTLARCDSEAATTSTAVPSTNALAIAWCSAIERAMSSSTCDRGWPRRTAATRTRRCGTGASSTLPYISTSSGLPQALAISVWNRRSSDAELVERHPDPELLRSAPDRFAFGGVGPAARELEDRQLEHATRLEQLHDELLARVGGQSSGEAKTTSGRCSATYIRLPRRSTTPSDTRPWSASRTDVRATPNCSLRLRSAGHRRPGCQLAGSDPFGEAGADLLGDGLAGDRAELDRHDRHRVRRVRRTCAARRRGRAGG